MTEALPPAEWMPVAQQAIGVVGQASERVQIVVTIAVTLILLAAIIAWYLHQKDQDHSDTVPADVLIWVTEEFSHQVQSLRETVDRLHQSLTGCRDCPYYQTVHNETKHDLAA